MAFATVNRMSCKQVATAPAASRTRVVKVSAMKDGMKPSAAFAAAAAAVLLVSSPAMAAPVLTHIVNPVSEIAAGPGTKAKQAAEKAADKLGGQGALAPDVEGQIRAGGAGKPRAAAQQRKTFVAASKEDQRSAAAKYPESQVNWRR